MVVPLLAVTTSTLLTIHWGGLRSCIKPYDAEGFADEGFCITDNL
jgi:hypothetical protein